MKIKGCLLLVLSALVGLVTVVIFVVGLVKGIAETTKGAITLDSKGTRAVRLEPGDYTVFLESDSGARGSMDISQLKIYGPQEGKMLTLERTGGGHYTMERRHGRSVARFLVSEGGEYQVEIGFEPGGSRIVLIRNFLQTLLGTIFGSLAIIFGGLFLALLLMIGGIVVMIMERRKAPLPQ